MNVSSINDFVEKYCELHEITQNKLFSSSRHRPLVEKRMILAYFLRKGTNMSWNAIGRLMNKNHASMIHYVNKIETLITVYPYLKRMFDSTNELYAQFEHSFKEHSNIYKELLIENQKLKDRINRNIDIINTIIEEDKKGYLIQIEQ